MCMRDLCVLLLVLVTAGCTTAGSAPSKAADARQAPALGQPVSAAQIAGWDISIAPDGTGLPAGRGTSAQGAPVYAQKCQACHGAAGAGQPNDRLVGGQGTLAGATPVRTIGSYWPYATTVFDYVRRAMPYLQPQSLTDEEVYALTAYLLHLNGIIGEQDEMNAQTLPKVRMPNRDNFILMYPAPGR
jgi:S-disulfanyl-L-cysteine oxidoreductase SoxD